MALVVYCLDPKLEQMIGAHPLWLGHGEVRSVEFGGRRRTGVHGWITLEGESVSNARIYLSPLDGSLDSADLLSDADGRYHFVDPPAGEYELSIIAEVRGLTLDDERPLRYAAGTSLEENFQLDRTIAAAAYTGNEPVTLSPGEPVPGRTVTVAVIDAATGSSIPEGICQALGAGWTGSFEDGVIIDDEPLLGVNRYRVASATYVPASIDVTLAPEEASPAATISLWPSSAVQVTQVRPASRAQQAGLEVGDIIVRCGNAPVRNVQELRRTIGAVAIDRFVGLRVVRSGEPLDLSMRGGPLQMEVENWRVE